MGIKTKTKELAVIIDPLSFMADIVVLAGAPVQTYNEDSKEFESDRRVLPCMIVPSVSAWNKDEESGKKDINTCEWYIGSPKADKSNKIENGADFEISPDKYPPYTLKVMKNVDANEPMEIHSVFTFVDARSGKEVRAERSIVFYTSLYDSKSYALRIIDQPQGWVVDPLRTKETAGKWLNTITAQLYQGSKAVPDGNAAYFWDVIENGVPREITKDELDIFISGKNAAGHWGKAITFDARLIRNMTFRCRAAYYNNGVRPSVPTDKLAATSAVKVEFPKTLRAEIRQLAGAKVNASLTTNVILECMLTDNMGEIPASHLKLFKIIWKAVSGKPGVAHKKIGEGKTISFSPSSFGFDKNYSMSVYADVKMHAVTALVTKNNKVLTSAGKVVTATKYE